MESAWQHEREVRIAYERGAADRFTTLLVGILIGAASGALFTALGFWAFG